MGLTSILNTALRPAFDVLLDASLTGSSFAMSILKRNGWFKYGAEGKDGSIYTDTGSGVINMTFPDVSNRNFTIWKGGTSGYSSILSVSMFNQSSIESLDVTNLDSLNTLSLNTVLNIKTLKVGESKDDAFSQSFFIYRTGITTLDVSSIKNVGSTFAIYNNTSLETLILPKELSGKSYLNTMDIYGNNLLGGVLDISCFKYLNENVNLRFHENDFNSVILPDVSAKINTLYLYNNNIAGNLDLTSLKGLAGNVRLYGNPITSVTWPETSANFSDIHLQTCNLSSLDLSNLTGGIGYLRFDLNYNFLTEIKLPDSSFPFSTFNFSRNYAITTLDVSNRMFQNCNFSGDYCSNLQKIILPDSSCSFSSFFIQNGNLQGVFDVSNHYFSGNLVIANHPNLTEFVMDVGKCSNLSGFTIKSCGNLTGGYDLSAITTLSSINVEYSDIGYVIPPIDRSNLNYNIAGSLCASNGIVDLSSVKSIGSFNSRLTDASVILWPYDVSTQELSSFIIDGCNFSGVIDLSMFPSISQTIQIYSNPNVTGLILPDSSSSYAYGGAIYAYNCDLTGNLDLSRQKNRINLELYNNPKLTSVDMPEITKIANYHLSGRFHDCSLNQTTVDAILSTYRDLFESITIGYNFVLSLEGGNNAVPTDGSLNSDILALESLFGASSRTLTLTYNT